MVIVKKQMKKPIQKRRRMTPYPAAKAPTRDDEKGHLIVDRGENLTPRYNILSKLGEGSFGRVLECWDRKRQEYVAIKVVRNASKYSIAAMVEVDTLERLAKHDDCRLRCVKIRKWFDYHNHVCIVFEKLGPSLLDFLKKNKYSPCPVNLVREFGQQLLESVAYIHNLDLIHTDLKPENILLVSSEYEKHPSHKRSSSDVTNFMHLPKNSAIKLIDFGCTAFGTKSHSSIVSTRPYRAPEVIIGPDWSFPCDLWSVGCILMELCTGKQLFQTHENLEHLAMMERVLGPLPKHMIQKANQGAKSYFWRSGAVNWPDKAISRDSIRAVGKLDCLKNMVSQHVEKSSSLLADLLGDLLKYDPLERLTAHEALLYPFFKNQI